MNEVIWIIIAIVIIGGGIYLGVKRNQKLLSEGKIITRKSDFMESAEEFTLTAVTPEKVTEAVKALDYKDLGAGMQGSSQQQAFKFNGYSWNAQLFLVSGDENQAVYRFEFTNWKTHNGSVQNVVGMNKMITAVEKLFLALDPNTQVRTIPLEVKTKHNFF